MADRLTVGRVSKPHGLSGEVLVLLTTDRRERVAPDTILYTGERQLRIESARPHQNGWLVCFEGIDNREAAEAIRGLELSAPPLVDDETLWVHELVGSVVVETNGTERGIVEAVEANPASDLLVLETGALVPLTFVVEHSAGRIVIDPPEGLFEL